MEVGTVPPGTNNCCVMLCVAKGALMVLVTVFLLFLPLGDPSNYYSDTNYVQNRKVPMCCLCDVYFMLVRVVSKTREMVEVMICAVRNILYEAKLKVYSILGNIDRDDLCRSVCCSDSSDVTVIVKERRHPPCRCTRKCSIKKLDNI